MSLTAHVIIDQAYDYEEILAKNRKRLLVQFDIAHTISQHESKSI